MNENELVAAIRAIVEARGLPPRIVLGIGDDAAAWQPSRSHRSVVTTDALVDGVHFLSAAMDAAAIGHRALASNLSDIAAMGARPVLATVALGVAPGTDPAWILACYRGMAQLAARFDAPIVGGDIVRAPALLLAITVVGEVSATRLARRDHGRPGDVIAVTGALGASRAGLELLRRELPVSDASAKRARAAFATPEPLIAEGRWLAASQNVHAMMDCSDGLSTDIARLASASSCGAIVESVPVDASAAEIAQAAGGDPRAYALDGGEDFELIVAVAPRAFAHVNDRFTARFKRPLLAVGRLETGNGVRIVEASTHRELVPAGWDHLG